MDPVDHYDSPMFHLGDYLRDLSWRSRIKTFSFNVVSWDEKIVAQIELLDGTTFYPVFSRTSSFSALKQSIEARVEKSLENLANEAAKRRTCSSSFKLSPEDIKELGFSLKP